MTRTDHLEPNEVEIRDLLERTMNDLPVPMTLNHNTLQHGRRLRARRRAGMAAGIVAAAVTAMVIPSALGNGSPTAVNPAGATSSTTTVPAPTPHRPPPSAWPKGWWDQRAVDMISAVEAIAPDGVTVTSSGPLIGDGVEGGPASGYIEARLSGPAGVGQLYLDLSPSPLPGTDGKVFLVHCTTCEETFTLPIGGDITCPENLASRAQCSEIHEADGTVVGSRATITSGQRITLEVVLRRDGGTVYGATTNTFDDNQDPPVGVMAENPPLTMDQLEDLVRNDTWVRPAT